MMNPDLSANLKRHIDLLGSIESSSSSIIESLSKEDFDKAENSIENRDRLINLVTEVQGKIETELSNANTVASLTSEDIRIVKTWQLDTQEIVAKVELRNQELIRVLEAMKKVTGQDISEIFKKRQKFKGYNLNNLQR